MAPPEEGRANAFYQLELQKVPACIWTTHSNVDDWYKLCTTAGKGGFPPSSLARLPPCPFWVQLERGLYFLLYYLTMNILPFGIPLLPLLRLFTPCPKVKHFFALVCLQMLLLRVQSKYWKALLTYATMTGGEPWRLASQSELRLEGSQRFSHAALDGHFVLERQNHRYFGTRWILPRSVAEGYGELPPSIVCMTPHGLMPLGASAAICKVLGGRMVRWGGAPVLFKVLGISGQLKRLGLYPAGKRGIIECLSLGDHAGLVLDGIAGMFCQRRDADEDLYLLERKAVCKIALEVGSPILPCYCFGTNDLSTVVDPFLGLLRWASVRFDISLTPFFGRWWLPFGPPARRPLLMCFGDPIPCPKLQEGLGKEALQATVDAKHSELLTAYRRIFDTHKAAYGRPSAQLRFV